MRNLFSGGLVFSIAVVTATCGGVRSNDLFSEAPVTDGGSLPTLPEPAESSSARPREPADTPAIADAGTLSASDASPAPDPRSVPDANPPRDPPDPAPVTDGGNASAPRADAGASAPPQPPLGPAGTVMCGRSVRVGDTRLCDLRSQVCCANRQGGDYQCVDDCAGIPIACDGASDCDQGEVCCGMMRKHSWNSSTGDYERVECRRECSENTPERLNVIFCDGLDPTQCPNGLTCQLSSVMTGFSVCANPR